MSEVSGAGPRGSGCRGARGREGARGWPGPGGEERGPGSDWRREASSRRCGWRFAGAAVSGKESPPRDAVPCVRHGPRLLGSPARRAAPLGSPALLNRPRPPRGPLSPARQHLVSRQGGGTVAVFRSPRGASAEMSPQSRPPSACSWCPGLSSGSVVSLPARPSPPAVLSSFHRSRSRAGVRADLAALEDAGLCPRARQGRPPPPQAELGLGSSVAGLLSAARPRYLGSRVPASARAWARFQPGTQCFMATEVVGNLLNLSVLHFLCHVRIMLVVLTIK